MLNLIFIYLSLVPSTSRQIPDRNIEVPIARVEPSNSTSTIVHSNNYGFKCPICDFNSQNILNSKFDQRSAIASLAQHIVNFHDNEKFDEVLSHMKDETTNAFSCPSEGCSVVYHNKLTLLRQHVLKTHPTYLKGFLKKHRKTLNLSSCLTIKEESGAASLLRNQLKKMSNARFVFMFIECDLTKKSSLAFS